MRWVPFGQDVELAENCFQGDRGVVVHEICHALGKYGIKCHIAFGNENISLINTHQLFIKIFENPL